MKISGGKTSPGVNESSITAKYSPYTIIQTVLKLCRQ